MRIASINIAESCAGDAGATVGTTEHGVVSFASFLSEGSGVGTAAPNALSATEGTLQEATDSGGDKEGVEGATALNAESVVTVPVPHGLNDLVGERRTVMAASGGKSSTESLGGKVKSAGPPRGQVEAKAKKVAEDLPGGQALADSAVPIVITPRTDEAEGEAFMKSSPSHQTESSFVDNSIDDVAPRAVVGKGLDGATDESVSVAGHKPVDPKKDAMTLGADSGSVAETAHEGGPELMAVAVLQPTQLLVDTISANVTMQSVQPESVGWSDRMQSTEAEATFGPSMQKKANALPNAADKSSIPAATSLASTLVADPTQGRVNQQAYYASNGSGGDRFSAVTTPGTELASPDPASASGNGAGKSDGRQGAGASPASSTTTSSVNQLRDIAAAPDFGLLATNVSTQLQASTTNGDLRQDVSSTSTLSASEQFAMERLQTTGATKALGDVLQSAMGLGVQTESFGRVTIHTATEGNHLLAQVTLEDGRQSATLVSHLPAVEQKLMQQFGLEAAVNVSTGSRSSSGGGLYGDKGHDPPQQRRETGDTKLQRSGDDLLSGLQPDEEHASSPWSRSSNIGRLDVTV